MGIENGDNLRKVEESEEVTPEQKKGGGLEVPEESNPKLVAQEQQVEQEAIPEPSSKLLEIGPNFDENWVYYDNQDRAILRLKKGDIEELKIELQKALESGQITLSNGELKRLDIPEEQKEIKRKLQTIESTIQALIQSNTKIPKVIRELIPLYTGGSENKYKHIDKSVTSFIDLIKNRRRFKFGIGKNEIQALESLRESIKAESTEYSQLQNSEQDIVDRDIIIKFQQLPKSIQQSIYSLENPTSESINEVFEAISSYKTPQELIEKKQEIRDKIKDELKNIHSYETIIGIPQKLGISEEILQEAMQYEEVQEAVVEGVISCLAFGKIDRAKEILEYFEGEEAGYKKRFLEANQEELNSIIVELLKVGNIDWPKDFLEYFEGEEVGYKNRFLEANQEELNNILLRLLIDKDITRLVEILEYFEGEEIVSKEFIQQSMKEAFIQNLKDDKITKALDLLNTFRFKLTYFEAKAIEILGTLLSYNIFIEISDLENGVIGSELAKIGVTKAGKEGIQELASILQELKSEFTRHNPESIEFENSEFITNYFMAYTGYKDSGWGNTDRDSFLNSVQNTKDIKYKPLAPEFEKIETYPIRKKERSSNIDKSIYREDFLNRFSVLMADIKLAKDNLENKNPLTNLVDQLNFEIENIVQNLKIKSQELQDNPQAQIGLGKRIELLEKINLRSIQDFQENFKILSSFSVLDSILRQVVFTMGFAKNRRQLDKSLSEISVENPSLDDISWVLNFVDHITNQEKMAKYFTDKKATKKFEEKINPTALTKQMDLLHNGQITSGTTNITFSTHRDLYTEISGQIADACWASKHESILTEFPNFSSILMVKDKETQNERIIGSSLLIETKSEDGDDLLIIRGLNPTQTMINSLDVKSYFEAVVDYARKLADSTGKKLAISIDDHSGGHTTNRPLLFNYISNLKDTLKPAKLQNPSEAYFNGYDLQGEVYLL